jgi:hypothetical protein
MLANFYETIQYLGSCHSSGVSHRLPTMSAWVQSQLRLCRTCDGQNGTGASFLQILPFYLPIFIPPITPHSLIVQSSETTVFSLSHAHTRTHKKIISCPETVHFIVIAAGTSNHTSINVLINADPHLQDSLLRSALFRFHSCKMTVVHEKELTFIPQ